MQLLQQALVASAMIMSFSASAQVAGLTAPTLIPQSTAPVPEKVICKSSVETGSLIKQHKACFTARQWHYVDDQHEREARKLVEDGTGKPRSE